MLDAHHLQRELAKSNQLPIFDKFANFWLLRKRRFAYVVVIGLIYHYDVFNRTYNWTSKKRANSRAKFERRWMLQYNQENVPIRTITHFRQSAEGLNHLKKSDVDELAKLMFEVENQLKHGFSRELVSRALMHPEMQLKYGKTKT